MKPNYAYRTASFQVLPADPLLLSFNHYQPADTRKLDFFTHLQSHVDAFQSRFKAFLGFVAGQSSALLDLGDYRHFGQLGHRFLGCKCGLAR